MDYFLCRAEVSKERAGYAYIWGLDVLRTILTVFFFLTLKVHDGTNLIFFSFIFARTATEHQDFDRRNFMGVGYCALFTD